MPGSHDEVARDAPDWENMTNKELHDKFAQMMSEQVYDIETRFTEAIDGVEKMIDTKLLELVLLLLLQLLLLLLLTSAMTMTTRVITRRRWNRKRPMNSQLDVHVPTFATVDTNHPLRYAMTNMCLNLN